MATTTTVGRAERVDTKKLFGATLLGAGLAVVINIVLWALLLYVVGLDLRVQAGPTGEIMPLPVVAVILFTVVPALAAGGVLWLLNRFTSRPYNIFLIISVIVLVLSFVTPLSLPISLGAKLGFELLHFGAALPVIWSLMTRTRSA